MSSREDDSFKYCFPLPFVSQVSRVPWVHCGGCKGGHGGEKGGYSQPAEMHLVVGYAHSTVRMASDWYEWELRNGSTLYVGTTPNNSHFMSELLVVKHPVRDLCDGQMAQFHWIWAGASLWQTLGILV